MISHYYLFVKCYLKIIINSKIEYNYGIMLVGEAK